MSPGMCVEVRASMISLTLGQLCSLLTLEYGGVLDDEALELSADNLQTRLHVAASGYLIALLHLLGTAGRSFGLANLQI